MSLRHPVQDKCLVFSDTRDTYQPFSLYLLHRVLRQFVSSYLLEVLVSCRKSTPEGYSCDAYAPSSLYSLPRVLGSFVSSYLLEYQCLVSTPQQQSGYMSTVFAVFATQGTRINCVHMPCGVLISLIYEILCQLLSNTLDKQEQSAPYSPQSVCESFVSSQLPFGVLVSCVYTSATLFLHVNSLRRIRHKVYANHLYPGNFSYLLKYQCLVSTPQQHSGYMSTVFAVFATQGSRIICIQFPCGVLVPCVFCQQYSCTCQPSSPYSLQRVRESSLTGGKVAKQKKFSSAYQLANIQKNCTG